MVEAKFRSKSHRPPAGRSPGAACCLTAWLEFWFGKSFPPRWHLNSKPPPVCLSHVPAAPSHQPFIPLADPEASEKCCSHLSRSLWREDDLCRRARLLPPTLSLSICPALPSHREVTVAAISASSPVGTENVRRDTAVRNNRWISNISASLSKQLKMMCADDFHTPVWDDFMSSCVILILGF